jgi:molybdopterin molybdotransferase
MDIPPFDKSTVDGFACSKADLGKDLEIVETIAAGTKPSKKTGSGQSSKIMTGAVIPEGSDMVFMVEESLILANGKVRFTGTFVKENISFQGEDIRESAIVLNKGRLIKPQDISVLASVGCTSVDVGRMPVISVISSGDELVEPSEKPGISKIRNTNSWQLLAQVRRAGAIGLYDGIARDDEESTYYLIKQAIEKSDIVIITGGVSMGDFDFVPSVLERAGVSIKFSRINVQPGKPTTFGIHPKALVFGLPGNPVSAFMQFELLVRPLIYRMMNGNWEPFTVPMQMKDTFSRRSADRQAMVPVRITGDGMVSPVEYHGSAHISALVPAEGIIMVPAGKKIVEKGEIVNVRQI